MLRALYTSATGMQANETQMDIVSNNLANASTTGFKKVGANFEDLLSETIHTPAAAIGAANQSDPTGLQIGLGTRVQSTAPNLAEGDLINTNNQLDLAIQGSGYFRVQLQNGDYAYTRAGNFGTSNTGQIITQNGQPLEPNITVPAQTTAITIGQDGTVTATVANRTEPMALGQIELATFTNPAGLQPLGTNLFAETSASGNPILVKPGEQGTGSISQGYLEGSNVSAVDEMVNMIAAQRGYEMNSQVLQAANEMLEKLSQMQIT